MFHGYDGAFGVCGLVRAILASIISPRPAVGRPAWGGLATIGRSRRTRKNFSFFFKKLLFQCRSSGRILGYKLAEGCLIHARRPVGFGLAVVI
jgi:hypothetical protein